jgi:hypothetical protein
MSPAMTDSVPGTVPAVVAGVHGSDHPSDVLATAFDEALKHGAPIVAVRAFDLPDGAVHAGEALADDLDPWFGRHPDVDVGPGGSAPEAPSTCSSRPRRPR